MTLSVLELLLIRDSLQFVLEVNGFLTKAEGALLAKVIIELKSR